MSPRSGGEAAKFGERYEGRWTARHLLYVLLGDVDSVTVEDVGEISLGAEFTVRRGDKVGIHQVKRQIGEANEWELHVLKANGLLHGRPTPCIQGPTVLVCIYYSGRSA